MDRHYFTKLPPFLVHQIHAGEANYTIEKFSRSADLIDAEMRGMRICVDQYGTVCDNEDFYPHPIDPQLSMRVIACLQYCQGISTDELIKQNKLMGTHK